jgi:hypothetical protein
MIWLRGRPGCAGGGGVAPVGCVLGGRVTVARKRLGAMHEAGRVRKYQTSAEKTRGATASARLVGLVGFPGRAGPW